MVASSARIAFRALWAFLVFLRIANCGPQDNAGVLQPLTAAPPQAQTASAPSCGGCYIVADVAGVVWYSQIFINTAATAVVGVAVGNGSRTTRTSIVQNAAPFTIDPSQLGPDETDASTPLALTSIQYGSTAIVNGATLVSPTAYNVFSAFSITSEVPVNGGGCSTSSGSRSSLSSAFTQVLPSASGRVTVDAAAEQAFIDFLDFTSCSGVGISPSPVALAQVVNLTDTTTMTMNSVPLAASISLAPTTAPTTASSGGLVTLTAVLSSTTVTATFTSGAQTASAPVIVLGNSTITPTGSPLPFPFLPGNASIVIPTGTEEGTIFLTGSGGGVISTIVPYISGGHVSMEVDVWTKIWALTMGAVMVGVGML